MVRNQNATTLAYAAGSACLRCARLSLYRALIRFAELNSGSDDIKEGMVPE